MPSPCLSKNFLCHCRERWAPDKHQNWHYLPQIVCRNCLTSPLTSGTSTPHRREADRASAIGKPLPASNCAAARHRYRRPNGARAAANRQANRHRRGRRSLAVLHLMIAGRLHWRPAGGQVVGPAKSGGLRFCRWLSRAHGGRHKAPCIVACARRRGSLAFHRPGGIDVLRQRYGFVSRLHSASENRTLKRALTDPRILSGIGNAYSDEILHAAQLSPVALTQKLSPQEWDRLFAAARQTLESLDKPLVRRVEGQLSRTRDGISRRHGGSRTLWAALFKVWRKDSADSLCRQRNQLLRSLPNGRQNSLRSQSLPPITFGLAPHASNNWSA